MSDQGDERPRAGGTSLAKPKWHHMLEESKRQALVAVDSFNSSSGHYGDFIIHMHLAWLYLLHAEFRRDGVIYQYTDEKTGKPWLIDGEPKTWELAECLKHRYEQDDPVRRNIELFIQLRNRIEHRYERALKIVTGGKAHALVINYEAERVAKFGETYSLAHTLRFPVFLQALTGSGIEEMQRLSRRLPKGTTSFIIRYEAGLDQAVLDDQRYDYRVRLVPIVGPKSDADLAVEFVNLESLSDEERATLLEAGREGRVITKVKHVEVASLGKLTAGQAAAKIQASLPWEFKLHSDHTEAWRRLKVRPPTGASDPSATDNKYCVWEAPLRTYLYTEAWVKKVVREIDTIENTEHSSEETLARNRRHQPARRPALQAPRNSAKRRRLARA